MATPPDGGGPEERLCPRCGTPFGPGQEYCLECGTRLGASRGFVAWLAGAWRERFPWYPGDWIWPVLGGLLLAVVGGIVAVVVTASSRGAKPLVATHPAQAREPVTPPQTATVVLPTPPTGTAPGGGPPQTPTTPPPATTSPRPAGSLIHWPANRNGWTVIVESIPASAGRSLAITRARAAALGGLPSVGVLESDEYSSLHPGYYVIFSGVYATKARADAAAAAASAKGFGSAYSREITS